MNWQTVTGNGGMDVKKGKARSVFIGICVAPAVILFTIFMLIPTFNVFKMSLYKWGGYSNTKEFVGLNNFKILVEDMNFFRSFQNTVLLIVCVTVVTMALSLIFAAIISREKIKGQNFYRIIFYIPNILSVVVISAIFSAIYDPNNGLLNSIIGIFRGSEETPILWLGDQKLVIYSLAIAMIWQAIGYYMVMYMASMASVPESLYESANLEGAGRVQQFFSITLPCIKPSFWFLLMTRVIGSLQVFDIVYTLTKGGPSHSTETLVTYVYDKAFVSSTRMGYATAMSEFLFLIIMILTIVQYVIMNKTKD